ncbi:MULTISPECIES: ABC transporter permease [unclassified Luteimonas]|uniref:ABC transporter permease n=1 Tax=unclassified Luteimonas TaxID=2629088 RepID=UPI0018F0F03C|nr:MULTISPECIES: ABC transporter permease [unclassified Luteimonas]MBJ6979217.1 ABC transporter permease [Luteimonas sp. MC1895]MBJ6985234.1 ABC transporter permease [Luteimonas sp. MC1750]QQO05880.1 ABC transporter permease [Luteimonas sp. MC1750]
MRLSNNTLWTVARKELVDLFRDRRTVMLGLLMGPLLFPLLVIGMSTMIEKRARTQLESVLELPVIGAAHAPSLVAFLGTRDIEAVDPPAEPERALREQDHDVVLRIPEAFPEQWRGSRMATVEILYDSSRQDSRIPVDRVRAAVGEYSQQVGALRMISRGISPEATMAVLPAQRDVATPEAKRGMLLAILPYFLILSAFLGGAYLVIDVTAGERERQSLEPLLATPSSRAAIMSGKILAACLFGMLSLALILVAFRLSFALAPASIQLVTVSASMMLQVLAVLLPMVLIGTTLLTLIAASVKSVKEAQSYMSILMLLPILPTIVLLVNPIKNELWQFAVPFLGQNQMLLKIVRSEWISPLEWATYLGAGFGLGMLLWLMAARLYHREKLAISA